MCKYCEKGKKIEKEENDNIYFTIYGRFLRVQGRVLSIPLGRAIPVNYCPMCRKEAGRVQIGIHKAKYRHSQWYYYLIPRRLTLKCNPPLYKWLWFVIDFRRRLEE